MGMAGLNTLRKWQFLEWALVWTVNTRLSCDNAQLTLLAYKCSPTDAVHHSAFGCLLLHIWLPQLSLALVALTRYDLGSKLYSVMPVMDGSTAHAAPGFRRKITGSWPVASLGYWDGIVLNVPPQQQVIFVDWRNLISNPILWICKHDFCGTIIKCPPYFVIILNINTVSWSQMACRRMVTGHLQPRAGNTKLNAK